MLVTILVPHAHTAAFGLDMDDFLAQFMSALELNL